MLSDYELERYQRQIILTDFGIEGQEKLLASKILVVGVGGLGSVVALHLTATGIGTIGLVEKDIVSLHNLQRQILYREDEIGLPKLDIAINTLQRFNRKTNFVAHNCFFEENNAEEIAKQYDIIIDCTDNYKARFTINDICIKLNKPFIYGAIEETKGQMAVFNYNPPCANYRTLFPNEKELVTTSNNPKGVIGILPSIIASLQVNEVIKIITNIGTVMKDILFTIDILTLDIHKFKLPVK
ncbi:MAG: HesA/MoeB/ThiF family protein [Bacteroidales bacterium]